jgi:hypothetical protein
MVSVWKLSIYCLSASNSPFIACSAIIHLDPLSSSLLPQVWFYTFTVRVLEGHWRGRDFSLGSLCASSVSPCSMDGFHKHGWSFPAPGSNSVRGFARIQGPTASSGRFAISSQSQHLLKWLCFEWLPLTPLRVVFWPISDDRLSENAAGMAPWWPL